MADRLPYYHPRIQPQQIAATVQSGEKLTAIRLARLRRRWGLSGPVAALLSFLAYGVQHD